MNTKNLIAEIIGWLGTIAVLTAFALASFNIINANNLIFQYLNLGGALGITYLAYTKKVYQSVTLNIIWAIIAIIAIINMS